MKITDFEPIGTIEKNGDHFSLAVITVVTGHLFWRDSCRHLIVRKNDHFWRFAATGRYCPQPQCEDAEAAYEARIAIEEYRNLLEDAESKTQPNE